MLIHPRLHQLQGSQFHRQSKMMGTMFWHEMGLGKTLTSLWEARNLFAQLRQQGVLAPKLIVIVPKSAVPTWRVECNAQTPDLFQSMIIVPYSQLHNAIKKLKYHDTRMIVFDEWQYLKSPDTGRAKILAEFLLELHRVNQFKHGRIITLTGTPMPNTAAELYTSWAVCCAPDLPTAAKWLLDAKRYDDWKQTFAKKKAVQVPVGYDKKTRKKITETRHKWEGIDHEDMLNKILEHYVHFRRTRDCIDLPERIEQEVDLNLPDDKLLKDANIETPEAYMALLERLARAKTPYMFDWVQDFLHNTNEQLVVFAMYRFPITELQEKYPKDVRLITGAESNQERSQNLKDFQEGKFRVLAMTYRAGQESYNLQNCRWTLYHGYPWHDAGRRQAMARTHRSGQKSVTNHVFLTSGFNDSRILGLVRSKEEATSKVEEGLLGNNTQTKSILDLLI